MRDEPSRELEALQDPDTWDWEGAESYPGNPDAGIILRVRFDGREFDDLDSAAERAGLTVIRYVYQAALRAAREAWMPESSVAADPRP